MNVWYLDSSALVKHHVAEIGSLWINATIFEPLDNLLLSSRITMVEVRSALARRRRETSISLQDHADALDAFHADCVNRYRFVELELPIIELASGLLDRYPLRAYDAIQLASALQAGPVLAAAGFLAPVLFPLTSVSSPLHSLKDCAQTIRTCTRNPHLFRIAFTSPGPS
jgi:hypothetical protein